MGNTKNKQKENEFTGIQNKGEADNIFKMSKNAFESRDNDLIPSRAPLHAGQSPKSKQGGRGNSPATGALAGQVNAAEPSKASLSESKLASTTSIINMEDSF